MLKSRGFRRHGKTYTVRGSPADYSRSWRFLSLQWLHQSWRAPLSDTFSGRCSRPGTSTYLRECELSHTQKTLEVDELRVCRSLAHRWMPPVWALIITSSVVLR